ncbi:MAG: HEAT repeat domain-containing protein [Planctomycetes bacterium]|nr:HEAT repeat domain-containing protein [Planctomycetota bacterium]
MGRHRPLSLAALILAAASLVVLGPSALRAQRPKAGGRAAGDVKSLLDQGFYSFEEGDLDAAVAAFEKAFALNPTSDALLAFVDKVTAAKVYEMVQSKDGRIAGLGRQILESSVKAFKQRLGDAEGIRKAIEEVLEADGQEQVALRLKYNGIYGRNLVPQLVPVLADTDLARRGAAINWIARTIGRDAVPVLQAARKHPDATVRRNVADLLGVGLLRHPVSLATLKAMLETDGSPEVKEVAARSLAAILSDLNGQAKELSAKEHFLENAILYYLHPHKNPFASAYYAPTVYRLEGTKVVGEQVADFQLSERMARGALEEALELDPGFFEAQVLTLSNDAAQVYEYDLNMAYYAKNESSSNVLEILEGQKSYVDFVLRNRVRMWPEKVLFEGLLQALEDGRSDVARKIVETIQETGRGGRAPDSLVKALEDTSSRLTRIAAAVALALWNPTSRDFDAGPQVISILSEAVVTSGVRTAQKVVGDQQLANRLEDMLRQLNMESYSPIDTVERAVEAVVNSPPDVVLMDENVTKSTGRNEIAPVNQFVNELRKHYRSANVPVVVVVPDSSLEKAKNLYESAERKVWVVPESIGHRALENTVFQKLFEDKDDSKAQATRLAVTAAEALNDLASVPTRMPVKRAVPSLLQVLKNRPDAVRIPCIRALGNLRAAEAAGELAAVFSSSENSREVRVEAMKAVGMALQGAARGADEAVLKTIEEGMREVDMDLRRASWIAFSSSGASPTRQLEALLAMPPAGAGAASGAEKPAAGEAGEAEAPAEAEEPAPAEEPAGDEPEEAKPEEPEEEEEGSGDEK